MLKVVKITEGGIDLETKTELPRAIVISNGHREVTVPANDIVIKEVVALFAENGGPKPEGAERHLAAAHKWPLGHGGASSYVDPKSPPRNIERPPPSPQPVTMGSPSPFIEEAEEGPQTPDDEGFEPGEEFNDGGTGASSL